MPKLTKTFCRMTDLVCRLRPTAKGKCFRSSAINATSAVSRATSEPAAPIAIPTVEFAMAGASLTPSPTMATLVFFFRSRIALTYEDIRSEEHTSELQSQSNLVCRLLLEKKKKNHI